MKQVKAIIVVIVMLLTVIIVVENIEELSKTLTLKIAFFSWIHQTEPMAFYFVMIIVFLIGIVVAGFFGILERFKLKNEIKRLLKEKKSRDKELNSLRNLPIVEGTMEEKEIEENDYKQELT